MGVQALCPECINEGFGVQFFDEVNGIAVFLASETFEVAVIEDIEGWIIVCMKRAKPEMFSPVFLQFNARLPYNFHEVNHVKTVNHMQLPLPLYLVIAFHFSAPKVPLYGQFLTRI